MVYLDKKKVPLESKIIHISTSLSRGSINVKVVAGVQIFRILTHSLVSLFYLSVSPSSSVNFSLHVIGDFVIGSSLSPVDPSS